MNHHYSRIVVSAITVLALTACGGGDSGNSGNSASSGTSSGAAAEGGTTGSVFPAGVTQAMVDEGQALFNGAGTCFACHGTDGAGSPVGPAMDDDEWLQIEGSYVSIVEQIKAGTTTPAEFPGVMLPRGGTQMTDDQVEAVAAYVFVISH